MDKAIPKLTKRQRDELHNAPPEVFRQWVLSLPAIEAYEYHPIYKLVQIVLDGIRSHGRIIHDETGLPEFNLLHATLSCNVDLIHDAAKSTRLGDEWNKAIMDISAEEIGKLENGKYFSDKLTFERELPSLGEKVDDKIAKAVLSGCDVICNTDNPFTAIKAAKLMLLEYAELLYDVDSFSLLLHALNPRAFPYWDSCFILHNLDVELEYDWAEFSFVDIYPFDEYKGYLDDCFDIQCSLREMLARNGTIIFTIAADAMLYPEEE